MPQIRGKSPGGSEKVKTTIEVLESVNHHLALLGSINNSNLTPPSCHSQELTRLSMGPSAPRAILLVWYAVEAPGILNLREFLVQRPFKYGFVVVVFHVVKCQKIFFTASMPLQEGRMGVLPFKSNTFYRCSGSPFKSSKTEGRTTHTQWGYSCGIILRLPMNGGPSHMLLAQVALPAHGGQNCIIKADPVIRRSRVLSLLPHHLTGPTAIIKRPQDRRCYTAY